MAERPTWDEYGLTIAQAASTRSTCVRRKVGAYITDNQHRPISMGYNGPPSGMEHCGTITGCPRGTLDKVEPDTPYDDPKSPGFCTAAHAEANAILHAASSVNGSTVYVTHQPCPGCMRMLAAAGVYHVIFPGEDGKPTIQRPLYQLKIMQRLSIEHNKIK